MSEIMSREKIFWHSGYGVKVTHLSPELSITGCIERRGVQREVADEIWTRPHLHCHVSLFAKDIAVALSCCTVDLISSSLHPHPIKPSVRIPG